MTTADNASAEYRECPVCGESAHILDFYSGNRTKPTKRCRACRDKLVATRPLGPRELLALEDLVSGRSPWWRYTSSADAPRNLYGLRRRGLIDEKLRPTAAGRALILRQPSKKALQSTGASRRR